MSNTEDLATELFPLLETDKIGNNPYISYNTEQLAKQEGFIKGYRQAENDLSDKARLSSGWTGFYYGQGYKQAKKDLELTWEDIQLIVSIDWDLDHKGFSCGKSTEEYYKEVLKQFNEEKKRK